MAGPSQPQHFPTNRKGRYVIVGCGFSAVLNHLTLRKTVEGRCRLADRQVLHIGHPDPWEQYSPHDMGQFPHLLRLPGYAHTNSNAPYDKPLRSDRFADATSEEFETLASGTGIEPPPLGPRMHGWVALIQEKGEPPPSDSATLNVLRRLDVNPTSLRTYQEAAPYRLLVVHTRNGQRFCDFVYADKIDLCVGPGVPRLLNRRCFPNTHGNTLWDDYARDEWEPVESFTGFRCVVPGVHGMYATTAMPVGQEPAFCVYGDGGIALNLVEGRTGRGWIDWMSDQVPQQANCDRNNAVFHVAGNGQCLRPKDPRTRLGEWVDIDRIDTGAVTFQLRSRGDGRDPPNYQLCNHGIWHVRNHWDETTAFDATNRWFPHVGTRHPGLSLPAQYEQVLVAIGLQSDAERPGTVGSLMTPFDPWEAKTGDDDQRLMALEYFGKGRRAESDIRILGSAAHVFPPGAASTQRITSARQNATNYFDTLPQQCRPGPHAAPPRSMGVLPPIMSITFNATAVAFANGYFGSGKRNRNVNTASEAALIQLLGDEDLAERIVEARRSSQFGFRNSQELVDAVGPGWRSLEPIGKLAYDYVGSDSW